MHIHGSGDGNAALWRAFVHGKERSDGEAFVGVFNGNCSGLTGGNIVVVAVVCAWWTAVEGWRIVRLVDRDVWFRRRWRCGSLADTSRCDGCSPFVR